MNFGTQGQKVIKKLFQCTFLWFTLSLKMYDSIGMTNVVSANGCDMLYFATLHTVINLTRENKALIF